ncbi:MAG: type VII secretion system-associated protein [Actinoplanes sp.]
MTDAPESPADPLDALLRLALRGDAPMAQLQLALRDSPLDLAMNGDGRPLVVRSRDDLPCVVVTTSEPLQALTFSPEWRRVSLTQLVRLLPGDSDIMINPNGPAPVCLAGDFVRHTAALTDDQAVQLSDDLRGDGTGVDAPPEVGAA